jgi:hypothetical protein
MFMFMFMCTFIFMFIFTFMVMPMSMSMSISCTGAFTVQVNVLEVDAGAFFRFCTHEREAKKERKSVKKKKFEKVKAPSAKEKSANLCFFLPQTLETQFQSPKPTTSQTFYFRFTVFYIGTVWLDYKIGCTLA